MKNLIRNIMATLIGLMIFAAILLIVLAGMTREVVPEVPDKCMLVLDLSVPLSDKPIATTPRSIVDEVIYGTPSNSITLYNLTHTLEHAAKDSRIVGLFLHGNVGGSGLMSGWAALKEAREALLAFKASGKKIYASCSSYGEKDLYLAALADTVSMDALGNVEIDGFASRNMYFARAFEKYGINVQVTRVGKYKSAVEPFLLEKMSPENREQIANYLGDLYDQFLVGVSESRGIDVETLKRHANEKLLFEGREAVKAGFVDKSIYFDEVLDDLKALTGVEDAGESFKQVAFSDYIQVVEDETSSNEKPDKIAVIYAEGEIVDGCDEAEVGGDTVARLLRKARLDPEIKGVVFRVNSPGGSATASEVILREVRLIRDQKPIVVSMGTLAASGGYWISTYAHEIVAQPNTITGSIGVFGMFPNAEKLIHDLGVNIETVRTADHAGMMSMYSSMTEEELALIQRFVDQTYEDFLDRVSEGRGMEREAVHEIAQGRVWSGQDALDLGLVDALGGMDLAIKKTAELAGLGTEYSLAFYQEESSFADKIVANILGGGDEDDDLAHLFAGKGASSMTSQAVLKILNDLAPLKTYNDPRGIYARMPQGWDIR